MGPILRRLIGAIGTISIFVIGGLILHWLIKEPKPGPAPKPPNLVIRIDEDQVFPIVKEEGKENVYYFARKFEVANLSDSPAVESTIVTRTYEGHGWVDPIYGEKQTIIKGHPASRKIRVDLSATPVKDLCIEERPVFSKVTLHWKDDDAKTLEDTKFIQFFCGPLIKNPPNPPAHLFRWALRDDKPPGVPEPPP